MDLKLYYFTFILTVLELVKLQIKIYISIELHRISKVLMTFRFFLILLAFQEPGMRCRV